MSLPKDEFMLLSVVNTKLRDFYKDLEDFCDNEDVYIDDLCDKLATIGYKYDLETNRFK
ncbi:MAG: DUF4250 domain-containing protein [Clostridia bacterium]